MGGEKEGREALEVFAGVASSCFGESRIGFGGAGRRQAGARKVEMKREAGGREEVGVEAGVLEFRLQGRIESDEVQRIREGDVGWQVEIW